MKNAIMKPKHYQPIALVLFIIVIQLFTSCDPMNDDLKVINNTQINYIVDYFDFSHETDSLKDKKEMSEKILSLYNRWDENKVNENNYYNPENIYGHYIQKNRGVESILTTGPSIPKYFRFYFINADILFENYQKGLPVNSFTSYEIKKYTRAELKKSNYQIIINE
jgi:hypothetical protein